MSPKRILVLAVLGESVLAGIALLWARAAGLPLERGAFYSSLGLGLAAAGGLALVNYLVLRHAPDVAGVRSIRRLYRDAFRPLFRRVGVVEIVGISVAAGVGEELLFRGVIQPTLGLVPASLLFGALHIGGGGSVVFGAWAAGLGGALGLLAIASGGWLAPAVAHVVYDAAALAYIRWAPDHQQEKSRKEGV